MWWVEARGHAKPSKILETASLNQNDSEQVVNSAKAEKLFWT